MNHTETSSLERTVFRLYRHGALELPPEYLDARILEAAGHRPVAARLLKHKTPFMPALAASVLAGFAIALLVTRAPDLGRESLQILSSSWQTNPTADTNPYWLKTESYRYLPAPEDRHTRADMNLAKLKDDYALQAIGLLFAEAQLATETESLATSADSDIAAAPTPATNPQAVDVSAMQPDPL